MTSFHYIARHVSGQRQRGELEASDRQSAIDTLLAQRLTPVRVWQRAGKPVQLSYKAAGQIA